MTTMSVLREVGRDAMCMIGLDIGGTKMACCVLTPEGTVHASGKLPTNAPRGGAAVAADAWRLVTTMRDAAHSMELVPHALGIAICELVDSRGQIASDYAIAWRNERFIDRFSELLPLVVEADCRAAAIAEAHFGAGRKFPTFLYVTVGTGISCSLVIDGKPYKGAQGATGTMATGNLSTICNLCGELGTSNLEQVASGSAIARRYRSLEMQRGWAAESPELEWSAEQVVQRARCGDVDAERILKQGATCLGSAIAQLVNVLDPHAVIVGGGLGTAPGVYWDTLAATARRDIWSDLHRSLPIVQGTLGELAAAIGAALSAAERLCDRDPI